MASRPGGAGAGGGAGGGGGGFAAPRATSPTPPGGSSATVVSPRTAPLPPYYPPPAPPTTATSPIQRPLSPPVAPLPPVSALQSTTSSSGTTTSVVATGAVVARPHSARDHTSSSSSSRPISMPNSARAPTSGLTAALAVSPPSNAARLARAPSPPPTSSLPPPTLPLPATPVSCSLPSRTSGGFLSSASGPPRLTIAVKRPSSGADPSMALTSRGTKLAAVAASLAPPPLAPLPANATASGAAVVAADPLKRASSASLQAPRALNNAPDSPTRTRCATASETDRPIAVTRSQPALSTADTRYRDPRARSETIVADRPPNIEALGLELPYDLRDPSPRQLSSTSALPPPVPVPSLPVPLTGSLPSPAPLSPSSLPSPGGSAFTSAPTSGSSEPPLLSPTSNKRAADAIAAKEPTAKKRSMTGRLSTKRPYVLQDRDKKSNKSASNNLVAAAATGTGTGTGSSSSLGSSGSESSLDTQSTSGIGTGGVTGVVSSGAKFALKRLMGSERALKFSIGSKSTESLAHGRPRRSTVVDSLSLDVLQSIAAEMSSESGVRLRTHKQLFWQYPSSFVGSDAVSWLCEHVPVLWNGTNKDAEIVRHRAVALGQRLMSELSVFQHASGDKTQLFQDKRLYYVFRSADNKTLPPLSSILKPAKDYLPLAKLLLHSDQVLIEAIFESLTAKNRDEYFDSFVKLLNASELGCWFIERTIQIEVDLVIHEATLFRISNVSSVVLSKFVRLVSNDYLKATVQPILAHVASSKGLFELQATLLHEQLGTSINLAQVQEDNLASLLEACNFALDTITNSLNECPLPLRTICSHLYQYVIRKFPASVLKSVGGLFFLRFLCPCFASPVRFGMLDVEPDAVTSRKYVTLSRILQTLSNHMEFSAAEPHMEPINQSFIRPNLERMKRFQAALANRTLEESIEAARQREKELLLLAEPDSELYQSSLRVRSKSLDSPTLQSTKAIAGDSLPVLELQSVPAGLHSPLVSAQRVDDDDDDDDLIDLLLDIAQSHDADDEDVALLAELRSPIGSPRAPSSDDLRQPPSPQGTDTELSGQSIAPVVFDDVTPVLTRRLTIGDGPVPNFTQKLMQEQRSPGHSPIVACETERETPVDSSSVDDHIVATTQEGASGPSSVPVTTPTTAVDDTNVKVLERVMARYAYEPQAPDEMRLTKGDLIDVTFKSPDGWWCGTNITSGAASLMFPGNYIQPLPAPLPSEASVDTQTVRIEQGSSGGELSEEELQLEQRARQLVKHDTTSFLYRVHCHLVKAQDIVSEELQSAAQRKQTTFPIQRFTDTLVALNGSPSSQQS